MSNPVAAYFTKVFNSVKNELPFQLSWSNGVGGFDGLIHGPDAPVIPLSNIAKSVTYDGRRLLIINTGLGLFCLYERHVVPAERQVYCLVTTSALMEKTNWFPNTENLTLEDLEFILGGNDYTKNVGWKLKDIFDSYKKLSPVAHAQ